MEDFKRKTDATKQWVALKAKDLETLTFIRAKLGELYDKMLENQMRMNQNDMQKMRAHVVCILFASLPEYMHKAAKKYTDRSKNKEDSNKKRADREQKFDELIQAYPKVALAVFFREMEERLISVCLATKEQMEQEYRRVRRGQQLTMLEDQVYNMKSDLQKNGLAHLDSRMTKIFQQSKSKVKGNMVGSGSKSEQDKHRRSNSTASKHKHNTSSRARSKGKTNRSNSRKNQAPVRSASARRRQAQMRTSSKTSRQDAKTSSTRGRSNSQRQVSANRDSKSRQSKSSARSMTSHRSFSRHTSRSKNSQSQHGSRNSSRSNASRVTCT